MNQHSSSIERRSFVKWLGSGAGLVALGWRGLEAAEPAASLRLARFRADVTPPIGAPLCGGLVKPAAGITDPLLALGVVILGAGSPIVLCAVDWCEIRTADHVQWRERLARAAGTTPERVAVQCLHQHNAPLADAAAARICADVPSPLQVLDIAWADKAIDGVAQAIADSLKEAQPLTHLAHGEAKVEQVASNRRVMGEDGKVAFVRTSATKDARVREKPEGLIDPLLKTVSFWNGERKLATLHYYATHPMSFYGDGLVSCDFVGLARERRTRDDGVPHIYFTGCGGNVTAGKYNDGNTANRAVLTERIHAAMMESEQQAQRAPVGRIEWHVKPVLLAANPEFSEEQLLKLVANEKASPSMRISAALKVSYMRHVATRTPIQFTSLHLGDKVCLLHLPGEAFVEYQLFAQQQSPGRFVATASYGDGGPGYIPLEKSFAEGGYEPTQAYAAPISEKAMKEAIAELLGGQAPPAASALPRNRVEYYELGNSAGPAVLMLHGGQCSADDWADIAPGLGKNCRLILTDGLVAPLDPWRVWLLLDHLGVKKVALVGHSAGGTLAREIYRLQPGRVWAFVNIDSEGAGKTILARDLPAEKLSPQAAALLEKNREAMKQLKPHHGGDYPSLINIEHRLLGYRRATMTPEERAKTRTWAPPLVLTPAPDQPRAPQPIADTGKFITCPVLVYHTGRGKLSPEDISREWINENIQAADVDYAVIKESSHWPWHEHREWFLSRLEPFLTRAAAGTK